MQAGIMWYYVVNISACSALLAIGGRAGLEAHWQVKQALEPWQQL